MVGQKQVLKQIDNLIEKGFPRFIVITGQKGQGKTELAKYIHNQLENKYLIDGYESCYMVEIESKIDEIREMIEMAYKQTEPIIYLIQNADKMSINAQNSLLKLVEEPPQQAFIIMELQQMENTLETIKSRCQEIKMEQYNNLELSEMIEKINPNISYPDKQYITTVAKNYYQINLFNKYGVEEFYNFVEKVVNNIYKVQSANAFKISEKLDLKDDGNGYNINLFFELFKNISLEKGLELTEDFLNCEVVGDFRYLKNVEITSKYQQKLNINRNK